MIDRILEPEVMDSEEEALEYDSMDFREVNQDFALGASQLASSNSLILDLGTGTARIPILLSDLLPECHIRAIDLAPSMLTIAQKNVDLANKKEQIKLELADSKNLNFADNSFDLVISNSLVHHIPQPIHLFREIDRVVKPEGKVFIRDLLRPSSRQQIIDLVAQANLDYSPRQKQLFEDSLHAALTIDEVKMMIDELEWHQVEIYQSSPRHWTLARY
ncbi:Methyltransferase type 11 [Cyanobacterium stanieri PCC 7202]|uniref:Methyltransferase type 11 n=1 Tax=Cyanobacterium stanieri (strain ATCC 29140 / PCC 7202) TaxID=292563 RepID=K9YMV5_CYASC|nr:Methyltransferase type 11 [Cyanobacterium stanieri PCC 7202]